jgi:multiple sugar transport system substrate-binding protein
MISLEDGCEVLEEMRKLAMLCSRKIFDYDPIAVHEQLASDSGVFYCPFTYGYTNYSRKGYGQHLLKAADVPNYGGNMLRTVLGGTGLAVSSFCHNAEKAAAFAEYTASPDIQSTLYYDGGGQPAHRKAWTDSYTNGNCLDFFKDTLKTLDNAYLRPRYSGYLYFQDRAGDIVREYVMNGGNADTAVEKLNVLYLNSKGRH